MLELLVAEFIKAGGMEQENNPAYDKLVDYCEAVGNDLAIEASAIAKSMGSEFWY